MALLKDYEIPNTGFTVEGAYHVIMHIHVEKVLGEDPKYVGKINLNVYSSKEHKESGKGALGSAPLLGEDLPLIFDIDNESSDNVLTQAYNHLKSTKYYTDAEEV
jgi:hypothetical protein